MVNNSFKINNIEEFSLLIIFLKYLDNNFITLSLKTPSN